jgi:hypothetical protein
MSLSAQQHTCSRCGILIERDRVFAFHRVAAALDQAIGKIRAAGAELPQRLRHDFRPSMTSSLLASSCELS